MIYIECPHCHAIFSSPATQGKLPERVRCGECNTVFLTDLEARSDTDAPSQSDTKVSGKSNEDASDELTIDDFLTSDRAVTDGALATDSDASDGFLSPPSISSVENKLEEIQNSITGESYELDAEPESELPDLNQMASVIPAEDDPLKNYNPREVLEDTQEQAEDLLKDEAEEISKAPDDESSDLIVDRLDDDAQADEVDDQENIPEPVHDEPSALPEIQDTLISESDATPVEAEPVETKADGDAAYDKFRVYLESVSMADDNRETDHSITSEISAFIDEIDGDAGDFYTADQTETDIESSLLDLSEIENTDQDDKQSDLAFTNGVSESAEKPDVSPDEPPEQADFVAELDTAAEGIPEKKQDAAAQASLLADEQEPAAIKGLINSNDLDQQPVIDPSVMMDVPEDLLRESRSAGPAKPFWPYIIGGLLLILLLAIQYLHAHHDQFAEYPETRGLITAICGITGCEVKPQKDVASIQLLNHAVYSHPTREEALIIKALIRNTASFQQPYPVLELTLADLNDNRVALRRFGPGEYLVGTPEENALMGLDTNIPVQLQVLDPGQNAVAFEFEFL